MEDPIACSLDAGGFETRLSEFDTLFRGALIVREHTDDGIRFRFAHRDGLEAEVRDLATRELECCSFFRFTITVVDDEVWWDASVDDTAADAILEALFALPDRTAATRARE